jgi:glycosyltransferase involved in cell wall biosynthesis
MALTVPVAIDGRRLQERPLTGVGRWLANLLPHLAMEADIVLLTDAGRRPAAFSVSDSGPLPEAPLWLPARAPELVWIQVSVPGWLRRFGGLFHGTFNQLPALWRGPTVVTFHDLATRDHPEDFTGAPVKRLVWNAQFRQAAHQAGAIQTDSEYIRQAVLATYSVRPDQVVVAAPSVDPVFSPERKERGHAAAAALGVTGPYLIAVGGARRRGLSVAVEAWARARAHGVTDDLIVIGSEIPAPRPGLVSVGRVPDDQWADLLAGATALCYPTRYEGFGMPALEAAASGVPVVCARVGPLPEVLGEAPEWCEGPSVTAIAAGLERLLTDPARQQQCRQAGLVRAAAAPTWADAARVLIDTYGRVGS